MWASGECTGEVHSIVPCFEESQSGSSSMGMLGPRMECPGSPSATREMAGKLCLQWSASMCLHLLLGGASLAATWGAQWRITCLVTQRAASAYFLFRKVVLLCEQVERRKGKRGGGTGLRVIGTGGSRRGVRRGLDAFVFLNQARVRVFEVDERARRPGAVILEALPLPNPVTHVRVLRQPADKGAQNRRLPGGRRARA